MTYEEREEAAAEKDRRYLEEKDREWQAETDRLQGWVLWGTIIFWIGMFILICEGFIFKQ